MSITIYDVSRLSGVSTATVSRVFSNPAQVRENTRKKVYEAANVLHYTPNAIASSMARQRTDKIAFLICKKSATIMDEFYAGVCNGIMRAVNNTEYQLLISTADDWAEAQSTNKTKQIEGMILGGDAPSELIAKVKQQGIKVVLVNNEIHGQDLPCVVSDENGGVRQAVDCLTAKGHQNIAMLAGRFSPYISYLRYRAFTEAMEAHGLPVSTGNMELCEPDDVRSAAEAAFRVLKRKNRPTAIFAANDVIAAGVMKAAVRLGIRIPKDLAVIGCDDSTICSILEPELTSIHINCQKMGELAVRKMTAVLNGEPDGGTEVVPEELHMRGTV